MVFHPVSFLSCACMTFVKRIHEYQWIQIHRACFFCCFHFIYSENAYRIASVQIIIKPIKHHRKLILDINSFSLLFFFSFMLCMWLCKEFACFKTCCTFYVFQLNLQRVCILTVFVLFVCFSSSFKLIDF